MSLGQFATVLNQAMIPGMVIRMKLVDGKVTLVHRQTGRLLSSIEGPGHGMTKSI